MVRCSAAFRTGSQAGSRGVRCVLADTKREVLGPSAPDASLFISRHFRRQQSFVGLLPLASACCGKAAASFRPASNDPPPATRLGAPRGGLGVETSMPGVRWQGREENDAGRREEWRRPGQAVAARNRPAVVSGSALIYEAQGISVPSRHPRRWTPLSFF